MKVYYLQDKELGWDNVVSIQLTKRKCIEDYTDGEVVLETEEEVDDYLKRHRFLHIDDKEIDISPQENKK